MFDPDKEAAMYEFHPAERGGRVSIAKDISDAGATLENQEDLIKRCFDAGMDIDENTSLQLFKKLNGIEEQLEEIVNTVSLIHDEVSDSRNGFDFKLM